MTNRVQTRRVIVEGLRRDTGRPYRRTFWVVEVDGVEVEACMTREEAESVARTIPAYHEEPAA